MADSERRRESKRRWREANREKVRESNRRSYQKHKETTLGRNRQWAEAHPEEMREYSRKYREQNVDKERERMRRNREENREREREHQRRYRARLGSDGRRRQYLALNHSLQPEDWAALWDAQDAACYLCGDALIWERTHIDHDHRCCPKDHSCTYCRRGLACGRCNQLVGMAADDPVRLRRIAGNLETALALVAERLADKPEQMLLDVGA